MKKLFIIGGMCMVLVSCKKDFLEKTPQSFISSTTFYKTQSDFEQGINGVYAALRGVYGVSDGDRPGQGAWLMGEMRSDNTIYIHNSGNRGFQAAEYIDNFLDDATQEVSNFKYYNNYILVGRANQVLAQVDAATFDDAVKKNIKGQALFLRALAYLDLVQYFGDVPMPLTPAGSLAETALPRTAAAQVFDQIILDAKEAATLLPDKATQAVGKASSGAAKTLLGNAYIVLKKWADAETVLKEVVSSGKYALLTDYASLFKTSNKNSAESVFEVQFMQGATQGLQSNFIYNFLPRLTDPGVVTGITGSPSNGQGGWNTPTPDLVASYEAGDKRKAASIDYVAGYPFIKKYLNPHAIFNNTDDNFPVYRYAEVLLYLAEALNEQGKSTEAITLINQVRDRAFGAGISPVTVTGKDALRDVILKERRVELAFENKRWLDLVRTGKAVEVLTAQGLKIKSNPTAYYFPAGTSVTAAAYNVQPFRLLFPIPFREMSLNKALTQNDGY